MKKKICALALALTTALSMSATVLAADDVKTEGTQTVTTVVKADSLYTVTIPKDCMVPAFSETAPIGTLTITVNPNLWKFGLKDQIHVDFEDRTEFVCKDTSVKTTIPYHIDSDTTKNVAGVLAHFSWSDTPTDSTKLYMSFQEADWQKAEPGEYEATITYKSEFRPGK